MKQSLFRLSTASLKSVFDKGVKSKTKLSTGLFGNPYLSSAKGLAKFSNETLILAKSLTNHLLTQSKPEEYIRDLDRLSDMLCRVIDLCEFIRVTHPDSKYVSIAEEAHNQMFEYMNVLNTSKDLYTKLENVLNTPEVWNSLSEEERSVGKLLYLDFKKSGIDMDDDSKSKFIQLSSYISMIGQEFNNGVMQPRETQIVIPRDQFKDEDINQNFKNFTSKGWDGSLKIPIYGHAPYGILNSTPNRFIRKSIWSGLHSVPDSQIGLLNGLLKSRAALARLMGFNDYAEYSLEDKMVHSSKNVNTLLNGLSKNLEPLVSQEITKLDPNVDPKMVKPWDKEFLLTQYLGKQRSSESIDLTQYFSLGTVIQGLSDLFQSIYGIKFIPSKNGEVWHVNAQKLDAIDSNGVKIGNLYLDLFERVNKTPHPAHFTVVCSRQIPYHELNDPFAWSEKTVETIETPQGEIYQLPSVCLVCNYHPDSITGMTFLTLNQISTLFHEMGHAMHSLLGRTKLHNVSGTRCVTDFVELPSILNETFAQDERVLCKIGKHWSTGESISDQHLPILRRQLQNEKILKHCETYSQVKMAQLDQLLHSDLIFKDDEFDIVKIYHELESRGFFPDDISNWPGKFGHLFTYGALYYSYLLDRALATKVWDELFEADPFSREAGDLFRKEVLEWGGSRDPWDCVRGVLKKSDINVKDFVKV